MGHIQISVVLGNKPLMFLFLLLSGVLNASTSNQNQIRWHYPVDYRSFVLPAFNGGFKSYKLTNSRKIMFFDNVNLHGKPNFYLNLMFITFKDGETCTPDRKKITRSLQRWLECGPYYCSLKTNATPVAIEITNPYELEWVKSDPSSNSERVLCSKQPNINFVSDVEDSSRLFLVMDGQQNYIDLDGRKYYPDFRYCTIKDKNDDCHFVNNVSSSSLSIDSRIRKFTSVPKMSDVTDIAKCFEKEKKDQIKCLELQTIDDQSKLNIDYNPERMRIKLGRIKWQDDTIKELQACLAGISVGAGVYRGIEKLCFLSDGKIFAIDYPESYVHGSPLDNKPVNFELPK